MRMRLKNHEITRYMNDEIHIVGMALDIQELIVTKAKGINLISFHNIMIRGILFFSAITEQEKASSDFYKITRKS